MHKCYRCSAPAAWAMHTYAMTPGGEEYEKNTFACETHVWTKGDVELTTIAEYEAGVRGEDNADLA